MHHENNNHGSPLLTVFFASLGTVLKLIQGGLILEVLQYASYTVAILVGVFTLYEKYQNQKKK